MRKSTGFTKEEERLIAAYIKDKYNLLYESKPFQARRLAWNNNRAMLKPSYGADGAKYGSVPFARSVVNTLTGHICKRSIRDYPSMFGIVEPEGDSNRPSKLKSKLISQLDSIAFRETLAKAVRMYAVPYGLMVAVVRTRAKNQTYSVPTHMLDGVDAKKYEILDRDTDPRFSLIRAKDQEEIFWVDYINPRYFVYDNRQPFDSAFKCYKYIISQSDSDSNPKKKRSDSDLFNQSEPPITPDDNIDREQPLVENGAEFYCFAGNVPLKELGDRGKDLIVWIEGGEVTLCKRNMYGFNPFVVWQYYPEEDGMGSSPLEDAASLIDVCSTLMEATEKIADYNTNRAWKGPNGSWPEALGKGPLEKGRFYGYNKNVDIVDNEAPTPIEMPDGPGYDIIGHYDSMVKQVTAAVPVMSGESTGPVTTATEYQGNWENANTLIAHITDSFDNDFKIPLINKLMKLSITQDLTAFPEDQQFTLDEIISRYNVIIDDGALDAVKQQKAKEDLEVIGLLQQMYPDKLQNWDNDKIIQSILNSLNKKDAEILYNANREAPEAGGQREAQGRIITGPNLGASIYTG